MASKTERLDTPPAKRAGSEPAKPEPAQAGKFVKVTGGSTGPGGQGWNDAVVEDVVKAVIPHHEIDTENNILKPSHETVHAVYSGLVGIGSEDVIGDMVAAQLLAAHKAAMDCYRIANSPKLYLDTKREMLNQAAKLSRTSAALIEALNHHRGKTGQQTVRVEHVTVKDGGQAVIGAVAGAGEGGGRGDEQFDVERCHASGASGPAVRCEDPARDAMPGAGDGERALPDARREAARRSAREPSRLEAWHLLRRGHRAAAGGRGVDSRATQSHSPARGVTNGCNRTAGGAEPAGDRGAVHDGPGRREIERDVATVRAVLDDREAVPAELEAVRIGPGEYAVPCVPW